jgi:AraC family transcriptional regulator
MVERLLEWPGLRTNYAYLEPHEGVTVTGPGQIGLSFSAHQKLVWENDGRTVESDLPPGSAVVTGCSGITWSRVREQTEALEMYPDPTLLRRLSEPGLREPLGVPLVVGGQDGTVLAIATVLRRAHLGTVILSDVAGSMLAERIGAHLLTRYLGVRPTVRASRGRLDAGAVDRVAEFVDAHLDTSLSIAALAEVAYLSPFHFAHVFRTTTGMPPHTFVTSRRVERATALLRSTRLPVADVAAAVGMPNVSHFRRTFRAHTGHLPSDLRA